MNIKAPQVFFVAIALLGAIFFYSYEIKSGGLAFLTDNTSPSRFLAATSSTIPSDQSEPDVKVRYARSGGNDTNDGLSWKTAKETIRGAIESLPAGGGTIYFADNTYAQKDKTKGLWLMGISDPNYANPPAGWIKIGGMRLHLIGAAGDMGGLGQIYDQSASMLGGSGSTGLWISGVPGNGIDIDNMLVTGMPQPARLGIDSNGKRDVSSVIGVAGIKIRHSAFFTDRGNMNIAGPAMDIGGLSFWIWLEDDTFSVDTNDPLDSYKHAAINVDGEGRTSVGVLTIRDVIFQHGGLRYVVGSGTWGFTIDNAVEEGDFSHPVPPAVRIIGGNGYGNAVISGVSVADAPGTEATVKIDPSTPSDAVLVYNSTGVIGPATIMNMYPAADTGPSPSGQNQVGFWQGRIWGVQDSSRRSFGPTDVKFVNLANQNPVDWINSGGARKTLNVIAPDGTNGAGRCTPSGGDGYLSPYYKSRNYSSGDWVIFGVWARVNNNSGYSNIQKGPNFVVNYPARVKFQNGVWYITASPIQKGDGEWQWLYAAGKIISASGDGASVLSLNCSIDNSPIDYYAPILINIPAGTVSDSEAMEIARHLQSWSSDPDATPGTVSLNEFQKFLAWQAKFKGDVNIDGSLNVNGPLQIGKDGIKFADGTILKSASQLTGGSSATQPSASSNAGQTVATPPVTTQPVPSSGTQTSPAPSLPVSGNFSGYWTFDAQNMGTTSASDLSGNNNTGWLINNPSIVAGKMGQALSFNGVNNYVDAGNALSLRLNSGTLSVWIKTSDAGAGFRGIMAKLNAYGIFLFYNTFGIFDWGSGIFRSSGMNLADGNWHNVVATFQSGVQNGTTLYIDGNQKLATTITIVNQNSNLQIGWANWSNEQFSGIIDDARVYNRVLSSDEVKSLYSSAAQSKTNNNALASFFSFYNDFFSANNLFSRLLNSLGNSISKLW